MSFDFRDPKVLEFRLCRCWHLQSAINHLLALSMAPTEKKLPGSDNLNNNFNPDNSLEFSLEFLILVETKVQNNNRKFKHFNN